MQAAEAKIWSKVKTIWKDSLDLIPSPSVKIQIIGGKVFSKGNNAKHFCFQKFVDNTQQSFAFTTKVNNFPPIIWIFTEGDGIESRLSS